MADGVKKGSTAMTCAIIAGVVGCGGIFVIGILALIAVPNFMKFQCKSLQSEAKVNLSGLYTAEKAFFGEYGFYTSDLVALGWQPDGSPKYIYGFAYTGPDDLGSSDTTPSDYDDMRADTALSDVASAGGYSMEKMRTSDGEALDDSYLPEDSWVSKTEFKAAAVGDITNDDDGRLDIWTIDHNRNLVNVDNDCQ